MIEKEPTQKIQKIQCGLIVVVSLLMGMVLFLSLFSCNMVTCNREEGGYQVVEHVTVIQQEAQTECYFTLENIGRAETLAFFTNHCEITVYVGEECVYTLRAEEDDAFTTTGGAWVTVPLDEGDEDKEVRVEITTLYTDYNIGIPEFLLGAESAIHSATFYRAMPVLILGLCVIFAGFLLICLAIFYDIKGVPDGRLYALGVLSISAGMWRITYDRAAYLIFEENAVLIYTISLVSMMGVALSMLNCLQAEKRQTSIAICSCCYSSVYIVQLLLQAFGIADLRQTLKLIHLTIINSALAFLISGIKQCFLPRAERKGNFDWILSAGVFADLLLYYFADTSVHMIFTLVAILCYSILEGIHFLFAYVEKEKMLETMKKDLTLSRTTTMMSQIRSHFVFNVLNAISGMCKYDPQMADETVVRFARYLRNNIDIMEKDGNIPFVTDLQQLEDYVALEQVRFGDKIEFYTDIEVDNFKIPPLILQPIVENAIKHGISKKAGNGNIILHTREEEKNIIISVEDDGVGFDMAGLEKEKSVGVRNIRFRLEHLVRGKLDIQSEPGKGTTVTITIPKEERS